MQTKNSLKHEQYKGRPRIEDFISESGFSDEIKTIILDFASYLRANKMPPQWAAINSWKFLYKRQRIGYIRLINGAWFFDYIIPNNEKFEDYAAGENLKDFIWNNVNYCTTCISAGHCSPVDKMKIFGKDFETICWNGNLRFKNPNAAELENLKKLYDYIKNNAV